MKRTVLLVVATVALALTSELASAGSRADPISPRKGFPSEKGIGECVVLTNLSKRGEGWAAVKRLARHRGAKIVSFRESDVRSAERALRSVGPEYVILAVSPETVDMNFHLDVLEMCRDLDPDPMPDFHFGYLAARDDADLAAFVDRIIAREGEEEPRREAKVIALNPPGTGLAGLDYLLHFGHGQPWRVQGGMTGQQVGELTLTRAPVVFSGACFTGVLSRSYHPCAYQLIYMKPVTVEPEKLMSLNWVHAGVGGYLAALEGDRGEMAMAEWDRFRETASPLGAVIGYQYRLAYTSLPDDFEGFPRYVPGRKKRMSFYDVMLRGMVSRILISDPAFHPLREPIDPPATETEVVLDGKGEKLTVTVTVKRWSQGQFLNYLPEPPSDRFDRRIYVRVAVPEAAEGDLGEPEVSAAKTDAGIEIVRHHVRHEAWGGRAWLNLMVESSDTRLGSAGSTVTFSFPVD